MSDRQISPLTDRRKTARSGPAGEGPAAPRVMVVDDDPGIQLLMSETLAKAGFSVSVAGSGAEAIGNCPGFKPDLMLLDINMPVMDGIEACEEIKKQPGADFPIIMVTSVDDAVSIQRAFDAGASDFILKPVNWPLFQRRLDTVLEEWNRSHELDESNKRVQLLERVAPEQVMLVSRSGVIIEDLKQYSKTGRAEAEPPYRSLEDVFGPDVARRFKQRISGVLKTRRHNNLEFAVTEHGCRTVYEAQFLVDGRERVIIVVQNVSADREAQGEIYDLAFYDATTDLPNRHLFERCAEEVFVNAGLQERSVVLISLSFDNLSGDELANRDVMLAVAGRLRECLADCGAVAPIGRRGGAARVARVDAHRFMLALGNTRTADDVAEVCDRITQGFTAHVQTGCGSMPLTPRLGVGSYPADGRDLQTVIGAAHTAMHEACETGEPVCFNSQAAPVPKLGTLDYGNELRQALEDGQLELYFQPRMSLPERAVTCVEALLRWNHPMRGFVGLQEVLHLAKATGLIVPLGNWVLRTACEEARRWQGVGAPRVSVNLSQQEFSRQDLADRVIEILERTGLEAARLDLEFTEAALLRAANSLADLQTLKNLGVGLVLDDFGTGHTSLAYLKKYPIDALKIDGSFVCELPASEEDAAVCEVIVTMAQKLGMKSVAEGVETEEQLDFLLQRGCDEFQGFHICRPLPAAEIAAWLSQFSPAEQRVPLHAP